MEQPFIPVASAPRFYITGRQRLSPSAILFAIVIAAAALSSVLFALEHTGHGVLGADKSGAGRSASSGAPDDDKDDPNQIDTIVLGDPSDPPSPGRKGDHVSSVHPTILVQLPRFGPQAGLIPDSVPGRLLYQWLAAFNKANYTGLVASVGEPAAMVQMELRQHNGGVNLLSAKEAEPGVLVFRLRDQTAQGNEVLGSLVVREGADPPVIGSFSLRGVDAPKRDAVTP